MRRSCSSTLSSRCLNSSPYISMAEPQPTYRGNSFWLLVFTSSFLQSLLRAWGVLWYYFRTSNSTFWEHLFNTIWPPERGGRRRERKIKGERKRERKRVGEERDKEKGGVNEGRKRGEKGRREEEGEREKEGGSERGEGRERERERKGGVRGREEEMGEVEIEREGEWERGREGERKRGRKTGTEMFIVLKVLFLLFIHWFFVCFFLQVKSWELYSRKYSSSTKRQQTSWYVSDLF